MLLHNLEKVDNFWSVLYDRPMRLSQNQFAMKVLNQFAVRSRCGLVVKLSLRTLTDIGSVLAIDIVFF